MPPSADPELRVASGLVTAAIVAAVFATTLSSAISPLQMFEFSYIVPPQRDSA